VNRTTHTGSRRRHSIVLFLILSIAPLTGCYIDISTLEISPDLPGVADEPKIAVCCYLEEEDLNNDVSYADRARHSYIVLTMFLPVPLFSDLRIGSTPGVIDASDTLGGGYDTRLTAFCEKILHSSYGLHAVRLDDRSGAVEVAALCDEAAEAGCDHLLVVNQREYDTVAFLEGGGTASESIATLRGSLRFPSVSLFRVSDKERLYCSAKNREEFVFTILPWMFWWSSPRPSGFSGGGGFDSYKAEVLDRYGAGDEESSAFRAAQSILTDIFGAVEPGQASYRLGYNFLYGTDGPQNDFLAIMSFSAAAELGNVSAIFAIGWMYELGRGCPVDYAEAMKFYREAVDRGSVKALTAMGNMHHGGKGVPRDFAKAKKWYEKAAEKEELLAMYCLGKMYRDGEGLAPNSTEAVAWFRKAADAGQTDSMLALGVIYRNGQGLPANMTEANKWFRKAARLGDEQAQGVLKEAGLDW